MATFEADTLELKGLDQLVRALKKDPPTVRIGILGSNSRSSQPGLGGEPNNASIGAEHEFGSPSKGLPQRSFLRVPITENLNKELEGSHLLGETELKEVIKSGTMLPWANQIGVAAEGVVDDAFETSGGGKWAPWRNPHYTNQGGMLLVDTGQLRRSITSDVKGGT